MILGFTKVWGKCKVFFTSQQWTNLGLGILKLSSSELACQIIRVYIPYLFLYIVSFVFFAFFYIPFLICRTFLSYIEDSIFQLTLWSSWYENVIISLSICWVPETMISGYGYGVAVSTGVYICFNLFCLSEMVSICCTNKPIWWGNRATLYVVIISIYNAENS